MRFVVEVLPTNDESVQGTVRREGRDDAASFCGWLELLRLLDLAGARDEPDERVNSRRLGRRAGARRPGRPHLQQKLIASDGAANDLGSSVAIDGDTIVAGAHLDDVGAIDLPGSVYTFARTGAAARTASASSPPS